MHNWIGVILVAGALAAFTPACRTPGGDTPPQKRAAANGMAQETLNELYREVPAARRLVEAAPGYAVFTNISSKILLVGAGHGYGVVVDNSSGRRTYMKMAHIGVGVGAGIRDWRGVFVFNDEATMNSFVTSGWDFGGSADAAAVTDDTGEEIGGAVSVQGITIFTFTVHGLSLKAEVGGTKYWLYDELNESR
jgi:lipid-binding SYLF domain-containing protein